jgi:kumamolisin
MPSRKKYISLPGSVRSPLKDARKIGEADPNEIIDVTILLRGRSGNRPFVSDEFTKSVLDRKLPTREEFKHVYGADPGDIARLEAFAREARLKVKQKNVAGRTVILSGAVAAMSAAFKVALSEWEHPTTGKYRGRTGSISLPANFDGVIEAVLGLDNRPQTKPHFRRPETDNLRAPVPKISSHTPPKVASLYSFPSGVDGSGQCIGLIELGGGYRTADLKSYWSQLDLATPPSVSAVAVGRGKNNPGKDSSREDGEVGLDIEVAGSIAPRAKIVVYFAENTDAGLLNAITAAVHDDTHKPSILCISWGNPECMWTRQAVRAIDQALNMAAALGVTVCVAAGDDGATDGVADGRFHVDFPASSPHSLACGGTQLVAKDDSISSETVWNQLATNNGATGGGISFSSEFFVLPWWQAGLGVPPSRNDGFRGRGIPDVAGNADPLTGYAVRLNGKSQVVGGTGAVAALWSGLVALLNQSVGKPLGYINPFLAVYASNPTGFHNILAGDNGGYAAKPGWNACTGLGTPHGAQLAKLFAKSDKGLRGESLGRSGAGAAVNRRLSVEEMADLASAQRPAVSPDKPAMPTGTAPDFRTPHADLVPRRFVGAPKAAGSSTRKSARKAAAKKAARPHAGGRRGAAKASARLAPHAPARGKSKSTARVSPPRTRRAPAAAIEENVRCSVFGPAAAPPGEMILIQAFLHLVDQADSARFQATTMDSSAKLKGTKGLDFPLRRGASVEIALNGGGLVIEEPVQPAVWQGEPTFCQFRTTVPAGTKGQTFFPVVRVSVDGKLVGRIAFSLSSDPTALQPATEPLGDHAGQYKYAFVSYASKDRKEVLKQVQILEATKIKFFQDILSLRSGDLWEKKIYENIDGCDLFLLFWSQAAKDSPWVIKEAEYALARQAKDPGKEPDFVPVVLEQGVLPPPSLSAFHFNDKVGYLAEQMP